MEKGKNQAHIFSSFALASVLALSSCSPGNGGRSPASTSYSTSELMAPSRDLTSDERAIATRICYAYQSKNNNFKTSPYLGSAFAFTVNTQDCYEKKNQYSMNSTLIMDEEGKVLSYKPSSLSQFYNKVQTNSVGYLAQLCTKIQNNQKISNTIEALDGTFQISFSNSVMDNFTIKFFALNASGGQSIKNSEQFMVRTQFNLGPGQILGMDESYANYVTCPDAKKYSVLSQKFSRFIEK